MSQLSISPSVRLQAKGEANKPTCSLPSGDAGDLFSHNRRIPKGGPPTFWRVTSQQIPCA
jgi:hypothetical protein